MNPLPEKTPPPRPRQTIRAALLAPFFRGNARAEGESPRPFHHLPDGTFRNNHIGPINNPFSHLVKWQLQSPGHPLLSFPTENPPANFRLPTKQRALTWTGHATFLLQADGMCILTDPHFSMRASPFSFAGPKRGTPPAPKMQDLPKIDAVVVSHNHYDHLDSKSIRQLAVRHPDIRFFCPLRLGGFLRARGARHVREMDWGQSVRFGAATFSAEPCQHWSARFPWDRNQTLWASWVVEFPDFRFLFIGDTGYSPDFAELGAKYGGFDWAAIPIGGFEPEWLMRPAHISPEEAVKIFSELKTKNAVAAHWGTFQMTDEPMDAPPRKLRQAARAAGLHSFHIFRHGETREI